ncbi:MAG TPA: XRE family transcriptional regulator [Brevibacillus sp.]|nr:XRE family transcriptional regulator [Brevibacillus sp.]
MRGLGKPRTKFGKWLDERGIKQSFIVSKSGVGRSTVSDMASKINYQPEYQNMVKVIKVLKEIDPTLTIETFWPPEYKTECP